MARYLASGLPPAPPAVDYTRGITDFGMMLNDRLGCCTIAAVGHGVQVWRLNASGAPSVGHSGPGLGNRESGIGAQGASDSPLPAPYSPAPTGIKAPQACHCSSSTLFTSPSPLSNPPSSPATGVGRTDSAICNGKALDSADPPRPTPPYFEAIPDSTILDYYERWDGYNPADPGTDQGGVELDVLNDWRQQGFAGHQLDAFVAIDPAPEVGSPRSEVQTAIWLFGGAYIGVELPLRAQNQDVWDIDSQDAQDSEPGSWGGHAIYLVGYDSGTGTPAGAGVGPNSVRPAQPGVAVPRTLTCITWGQPKKMTWAWFQKYCSEAYALVSKDWLNAGAISPSGFDLTTLENDLKMVTE